MKYLERLLEIILSYRKTKLPTGVASFNQWAASVLSLCDGIPYNNSTRFTLATHVAMLKDSQARVSKQYFVALMHKAAATQIAYSMIQDAKDAQAKAVEDAKQAEATATLKVVPDDRPQTQG
jgi:hypothetical protein